MKTLADKIAVMQAFESGKKVRCRGRHETDPNSWVPCPTPTWDWYHHDYEVVPEPVEFWSSVYVNRDGKEVAENSRFSNREAAEEWRSKNAIRTSLFREVV